jgi:hypothetical protein
LELVKGNFDKNMSFLLAFGRADNDWDECGNEYTRFFVNEESINPIERLPHAHDWVLPMRPAAFGNEIIEKVFFLLFLN